jgi:hypothetical protein
MGKNGNEPFLPAGHKIPPKGRNVEGYKPLLNVRVEKVYRQTLK